MEATTVPLTLHPFTVADAERLLAGEVDLTDGWEGGYSFIDEPELIDEYLGAVREGGDPAPFGPYIVRRGADGAAIGGVNLFATDDPRVVEFVFGLVPAARGEGLGTHTVHAALALIRSVGAEIARAECEVANLSARRALTAAGMLEAARTDDAVIYELRV
ncbi:GNAT family N-acetyltransferase [Agromyces larvae]|uniref:GNAT family N-acetyltransferase n=1 Tax=Agromyces larvae TaxID=2929802 RepID=A0ABY4BVV1_9MICO|nr:GNAT family N-acetyltransferase [Agromyces larvae]UOE43340.1 GNAT family N-acetyltransferase [Agromyces larvae]